MKVRACSAMLCLGDVKVLSMTLRGLGPWSVTKGSVSEAAARGVDSVAEPKPICSQWWWWLGGATG